MEKIRRFRRLALLTGTTRCGAAPAPAGEVHNQRQQAKTISPSRKRQWVAILSTIGLSLGAVAVSAGTAGAGGGVVKNEGAVHTLPAMTEVLGASVDSRVTDGGANISIHTNGLTAGNAYTLWSISFSNPEYCEWGMDGRFCGPGDDGPGPQGFAVNYVGGHIVGGSGHLTISGRVDVDNAANAEFHVIVADHGLKDPSLLPDQIKTPGPGVQIGFLVP